MEFLSYEEVMDLFKKRAVKRFIVDPENQRLRRYHANRIVTVYTTEGTFLCEARVQESRTVRKFLPPKTQLRSYTHDNDEYCFALPGRRVCARNPSCIENPQQPAKQTEFCKIQKALCQDRYHQYKYVCDAIQSGDQVFSEEEIEKMSLTELNEFIRNAGLCHNARYEHLKLCPAFDNKQHRDYLSFLEHRITFAYQQKIAKEIPLLSTHNKLMYEVVIHKLDKWLILDKLRSAPFFYHLKINSLSREELDYLFMLHMRED